MQTYTEIDRADVPSDMTEALQAPYPQAHDHDSFSAYEAALLEWHKRVSRALEGVQLPTPVGTHYRRPRVSQGVEDLQVDGDGHR